MRTGLRRFLFVSVGFVAAGLFVVSGARACVPQPLITLQPQASGPSGSEITVQALAVNGSAEIRWNGVDGQRLGDGTGPVFSTAVTIPEAPPGLYSIVVLERQADGSLGSTGRASFEVTGPDGQSSTAISESAASTTIASHDEGPSSDPAPVVLITAGAGLLVLGALGGSLLRRRGSEA